MTSRYGRYLKVGCVAIIFVAMCTFLWTHGGTMMRAAAILAPWSIVVAFGLSLVYRCVNAAGWGLVLGSLGEPVHILPAARVWLASEACRWIPGSVWAFGSRAVLASARGIPLRVASTSVVLELVATVAGWGVVVLLGASSLPMHAVASTVVSLEWLWSGSIVIYILTLLGILVLVRVGAAWASRTRRNRSESQAIREERRLIPDGWWVAGAVTFFTAMAAFNGLILMVILQSFAAARVIPMATVLAINAVAWLTGFFAVFAPGGLVVREACLVGLLTTWIPAEQAIAVALAWRLLQVVSEIVTFGVVAATGLPHRGLRRLSVTLPSVVDSELQPHNSAARYGGETVMLGVA